jgi:hypothetical protein
MPTRDTTETRTVTLVDIPLVKRLSESGTVLDSELCFTHDATGSQSAGLITLLLPYRGVYTLVTRADKRHVVGQFRQHEDQPCARITYLAPALEEGEDDTPWLHMLDAMAAEAGRRGAHMLTAEVEETAALFKTLRTASYAIYARQEIWQRLPGERIERSARELELTTTSEADLHGIYLLYGNIVPKLVQPITELPRENEGFVYRKDERVEGHIGITEGRTGVYLTPHLHPDVFSEAPDIIAEAVNRIERCERVPVYVRVRRYQDWLDDALARMGFMICARQAVMVKHIAAGVRSAAFRSLSEALESVPSTVKPPTSGITEVLEEVYEQGGWIAG